MTGATVSAEKYIIEFLCGENAEHISYVSELPAQREKSVYIMRSAFFDNGIYGTKESLPSLPLQRLCDLPVLFGEPKIDVEKDYVVIHADLIASAYFLISRYEESLKDDSVDRYGRFIGKASLPYRGGFWDRPIVDEYSLLIKKYLKELGYRVENDRKSEVYLTHDVDTPWKQFHFWSACKRVARELLCKRKLLLYPFRVMKGEIEKDPLYTFADLLKADSVIPNAKRIFFLLGNKRQTSIDGKPYLDSPFFNKLSELLQAGGAELGYHISYAASCRPEQISDELRHIEAVCGQKIIRSRNHYLASRKPSDFRWLLKAGIREDFTMGYADVPGFRLGTARPVRWIDPETKELTPLLLHPLLIMDVTLTDGKYLDLKPNEAKALGERIIRNALRVNGDVCLLWHNNDFVIADGNHKWELYAHFLAVIKENRTV